MNQAPPISRPRLAAFLALRGIELRQAGQAIGCSGEKVRLMCLPFGHPRRQAPGPKLIDRIVEWTAGEITLADFDPPIENVRPAEFAEAAL